MNKKQGLIIGTLLVLIVCVAVLATKLNDPLYVNGKGIGKSTISFNNNEKKQVKTDYFAESRLTRQHKTAETLQTLKTLADDKNISKENRDDASKKYTQVAMNDSYESKIETTLKSKGYEEVICTIMEENKVKVVVKAKDKLTDKDTREIKNVVLSITKIKDVEIEPKQ